MTFTFVAIERLAKPINYNHTHQRVAYVLLLFMLFLLCTHANLH